MRGPAQTSEPTIQFIYQLIDSIREGKILIPRFQRPLVWGWPRQSDLLCSVKDGIPMGAIMLWRTPRDRIKWRTELAGHPLPAPPPGTPHEYLLDGLQRLSTLFAGLRGFGTNSEDDGEARLPIGYDLEDEHFVQYLSGSEQTSLLPLHVLSDSVTLLRFQRGLKGKRAEIWIQRSDELAKAFREYKVPVISIASEDFEIAARTFSLINRQGVRMEETDMIHALTWTPDFELRGRMESLREEILQPVGWADIDFDTILKVVKVERDLNLWAESAEEVSEILRRDPGILERAVQHLAQTADLLRTRCGILTWRLIPYELQATLLADAFRVMGPRTADSQHVQDLLVDWFWITTYGEMFTGLDGLNINTAIHHLRETIKHGIVRWSGTSDFRLRPIPSSTDAPLVRQKALALMLARQMQLSDPLGEDPFQLLAQHWPHAMSKLLKLSSETKTSYFSLGNHFLCDPSIAARVRHRLSSGELEAGERLKYLIPDAAIEYLQAGDNAGFIHARLDVINEMETQFLHHILERHQIW